MSECYSDLGIFNTFDPLEAVPPRELEHSYNPSCNSTKIVMEMEEQPFGVVSDDELASLNIKDLNRKLKEKGLPKDTIEKLKQRRRTLKNRKYATDCREKKDTEVQTLELTKDSETDSLENLEKDNEELREKLSRLKSHYAKVLEFAKKNNIELKPRNVPMSGVCTATTSTNSDTSSLA